MCLKTPPYCLCVFYELQCQSTLLLLLTAKKNLHYRPTSIRVSTLPRTTLIGSSLRYCVNITIIDNNALHNEKSFELELKKGSHPYITLLNNIAKIFIQEDDG